MAAATSARPAPGRGVFGLEAIDCDVHISVPSMNVLLPYLEDYWREAVVTRGLDRHSMNVTGQPANAPVFARPDWKPSEGVPGTDLNSLRKHVLDAFGTKFAIANCMYGAQVLHHRGHGRRFLSRRERVDRARMARPRAATARVDRAPDAESEEQRRGDRAPRRRQAVRASARSGDGRDDAWASLLLADLRGVRAVWPCDRHSRGFELPLRADFGRVDFVSLRGLRGCSRRRSKTSCSASSPKACSRNIPA